MTKPTPNPKVDAYLLGVEKWRGEFDKLRSIILECGLPEDLKWGVPCYTVERKNVVLMHGFKEYCALLFFKGALMNDPNGVLVRQTDNVQAGRQIRFISLDEIIELEPVLKAYIREAIELEKAGAKVEFKRTEEFSAPEEFQSQLDQDPVLKMAFEKLTPGRQRAYLLFFSSAKQSKTRVARIEKNVQRIIDGRGLDDE